MSEKYKARNPDGIYFITLTVIDWVDLFIRPRYKHLLINSLSHCIAKKGLVVHAYVIMSSHIHLIVKAKEGNLPDVIRDFKRYTNKKLIESIKEYPESRREWLLNKFEYAANRIKRNNQYKIWKDGYHPVELATNDMIQQRLRYIHNNPIEEEIVLREEDYKYSSARDYADILGELSIEKLQYTSDKMSLLW